MWLLFLLLDLILVLLHLPPDFHLSDEQQRELNKKIMENLCDSANNGGEGTYEVSTSLTDYEPKGP